MKDTILFILGTIISAAFGVAITHLAIGWVGKDIVLWGCIVLIFFGIVIGIGHTVIEGIVVATILGACAYFFVDKISAFVLYVPGALAGFSIFMIVTGLIAASKEAPQREAREREQKSQHEKEAEWRAERERLEKEWQERRKKAATLPIPTP
jgi:K+-sensing histidine kinase KdpD